MPESEARNTFSAIFQSLGRIIDGPTTWFREKVVAPNQQHYPWYHQKFRRVPTVDECYTDDVVCIYEANRQYKRDRQVDTEIVTILRERFEDCVMYESPDHMTKCAEIHRIYQETVTNWFAKYGDLGAYHDVKMALMKQKHRMIWERRHGPIGSGQKPKKITEEQ